MKDITSKNKKEFPSVRLWYTSEAMARQKLSEYKAKKLFSGHVGLPCSGTQITHDDEMRFIIDGLDATKDYVVKVDQGIKGRFKKGLVQIHVPKNGIESILKSYVEKGFSQFFIEEMVEHTPEEEKYIAILLSREGYHVSLSQQGGIHIESHADTVKTFIYSDTTNEEISRTAGLSQELIQKLISFMELYHVSFLEINPYLVQDRKVTILDLAIEVDSAGEFFVQNRWTSKDFVSSEGGKSFEEMQVAALNEKSQASFSLSVLNKNGSIFMLLSGGGASIVLADEVYNRGYGKELANYGEYSGNPNEEETYLYTKEILSLLFKSHAKKKVLIIAGGVANFTDIRITFKGILKALDEKKEQLRSEGVKVYVRRGGPYQEEGLRMMEQYLKNEDLYGHVAGPEMILTNIIDFVLEEVKR